jgi:DNA-directed RNA polymerase specialized sigma24 family protein
LWGIVLPFPRNTLRVFSLTSLLLMDNQVVTSDTFEALLSWLGITREEGAQKYETIRARLIRIFIKKGCTDPEDLADITINRVMGKVSTIRIDYVGDPATYFCGVARIVYFEYLRRKEFASEIAPVISPPEPVLDDTRKCLRMCLSQLPSAERELMLDYHVDETSGRIELRSQLASELGISSNALRLKVHRIRNSLEKCVLLCLMKR